MTYEPRRRNARRRRRQRRTLLRFTAAGLFCLLPLLAAAGVGYGWPTRPQPVMASNQTAAPVPAQAGATENGAGEVRPAVPENDPFKPLAQPAAAGTGGAPAPAVTATGAAAADQAAGTPDRDPFRPLVASLAPGPSAPAQGGYQPEPGGGETPPPAYDGMELVTTFISNHTPRAYLSLNGVYHDVAVGDEVGGYRVRQIDHAAGQVTLEKDQHTVVLAAGAGGK